MICEILFFLYRLFVLSYFVINNSIGEKNSFLYKINIYIPQNIKDLLKETIFVFKNQKLLKQQLEDLYKKIEDQECKDPQETHQDTEVSVDSGQKQVDFLVNFAYNSSIET